MISLMLANYKHAKIEGDYSTFFCGVEFSLANTRKEWLFIKQLNFFKWIPVLWWCYRSYRSHLPLFSGTSGLPATSSEFIVLNLQFGQFILRKSVCTKHINKFTVTYWTIKSLRYIGADWWFYARSNDRKFPETFLALNRINKTKRLHKNCLESLRRKSHAELQSTSINLVRHLHYTAWSGLMCLCNWKWSHIGRSTRKKRNQHNWKRVVSNAKLIIVVVHIKLQKFIEKSRNLILR